MSTSRGTTRIQRRDRKSRACALYTVHCTLYSSVDMGPCFSLLPPLKTNIDISVRILSPNFHLGNTPPTEPTHLTLCMLYNVHQAFCPILRTFHCQIFCRCVVRRCVVRICVIKRFVSVSSRYISICTFTYQTEPTQVSHCISH